MALLLVEVQHPQSVGVCGKEDSRLVIQQFVVGPQCPEELVECRILPEGCCVGPRSFGIGIGLDALGLSGSIGVDAALLVVGLGDDPLRLQLTRRAVLLGDLGPLGLHAFEDMLPVQLRRVEAANVDADHIDAVRRSDEIGDAANDFRRHGLVIAFCRVGGDEDGRRIPAHDGAELSQDNIGETLFGHSRGRERGEKAFWVGDPPCHEAVDAEVLLVNRQEFGRRRAKEQDAFVQPHDTVKWRNDVEAGLGDDTDHTPEAGDKSIFGDVEGEERGNKSPDRERRRQCRQSAPKHDLRSFIRRGGLFRHFSPVDAFRSYPFDQWTSPSLPPDPAAC